MPLYIRCQWQTYIQLERRFMAGKFTPIQTGPSFSESNPLTPLTPPVLDVPNEPVVTNAIRKGREVSIEEIRALDMDQPAPKVRQRVPALTPEQLKDTIQLLETKELSKVRIPTGEPQKPPPAYTIITPAVLKPPDYESRPTAKMIGPFRYYRTRDGLICQVEAEIGEGRKQPRDHVIGDPLSASVKAYDPFFAGLWQLQNMFWDLEAQLDPITKERDGLRDQQNADVERLKGELAKEHSRVMELQARLDRMEKRGK